MEAQKLIELLNLEPHRKGGYFPQTYKAKMAVSITKDREKVSESDPGSRLQRPIMTSILYLLTSESPTLHLNLNRSDIIHYYHHGSPVEFIIVRSNTELRREILGPNVLSGEYPQVMVGGCWKCATMRNKSEGISLTSEAVAPGFDYDGNILASEEEVRADKVSTLVGHATTICCQRSLTTLRLVASMVPIYYDKLLL